MTVESPTDSLSEDQWQIARAIAITLVKEETDVNELGKAISYLRASVAQPDVGVRFFKYLKTLVSNGRQIGHSGRTSNYYRSIDKACSQYLQEQANPHTMLQILGWAARLMRYYRYDEAAISTDELAIAPETGITPIISERQEVIAKVMKSQDLAVGQVLEAKITKVKGKEVTYELFKTIKLTVKEPKKYKTLSEGQTLSVEVTELKDDGSPKKVKCVD